MKPKSNGTVRKEWQCAAVLVSLLVLLSFSITPTLAQLKKVKRITAVRLGTATEGSRVSIHSDSPLNDYEAFRRGDRFFVRIPSASFLSSQPLFRGAGFQEVLVQEIGDTVVISFWLQPGASANVEQRGTKLDVVFSVFGGVALPRNYAAPTSGEQRQRWSGAVGTQAAEVNRQDRASEVEPVANDIRPSTDRAGAAADVTTPSVKKTDAGIRPDESVSKTDQSTSPSPMITAGQIATPPDSSPSAPGSSKAAMQNAQSDQRSNWERRRDEILHWVRNNWLATGSIGFLLMSLALWLVGHNRSRADRFRTSKASQAPAEPEAHGSQPVEQFVESVSLFTDVPAETSSAVPDITDDSITEIPSSASPDLALNTLPTPPTVESVSNFPEANALNSELLLTNDANSERLDAELKKLYAGEDYDSAVIDSSDPSTRRKVAAALLAAAANSESLQQQSARQAFIDHGFLDEVTAELRTAELPSDRVAAARKLGVIGSLQASQSLLVGLCDSAPEVRFAAVEALGKVGDRSALPALNDLLLLETSELLSEDVIRRAINSITMNETWSSATERRASTLRVVESPKPSEHDEAEAEFIEFVDQFELTETVTLTQPPANVTATDTYLETIDAELAAEEERLREEEEALRRAAEELEQRRLEAETARKMAEEEARLKAESEAQLRAEVEARIRAEEEARRRAMEEAARRQAEEEARLLAEQAERNRAEEEARRRAEEEARFHMEAQTLRRAAEELARKRAEAEAARKLAEEEARKRQEEEARRKLEEELRQRAEEEARLQAEAEARRKQEEAEALQRAIEEARQVAEEERRRKAEEEARLQAEAQRRLEEERAAQEAHELRLAVEQRLLEEQEALARAAVELARRRAEIEEARRKAEEEARLLAETRERMRAEEEATRRRLAEERERIEAETQQRIAAELKRLEEARRLAEEQQRTLEEEARRQAQEEQERLNALEELRARAEQEARRRAEQEQRIRAEIEALRRAEEEQRQRIEVETRRRAETEARIREEEEKRRLEEEARRQAEEEAQRLAAEAHLRAEEEALRRAEAEALLREQEARLRAEEAARLLAGADERRVAESEIRTEKFEAEEVSWIESAVDNLHSSVVAEAETTVDESSKEPAKDLNQIEVAVAQPAEAAEQKPIPPELLRKLESQQPSERAAGLMELARMGNDENFENITRAFDDSSVDVRNAAARALYALHSDRAASFTRALREGSAERRQRIGNALAESGLAGDAIGNLTGESREKTYDAFSLLFLMAKAGEVQPLMKAIEAYPNIEVRLAVVKLLALSGQPEIVPAFRRLAVRGSLPSEVRSAVMEAIYQISSQTRETTPSAA
jgi:hypothetical protein